MVEVDESCTTICSVTRSKVKVKVTSPCKLEILPFLKVLFRHLQWVLATDHWFLNYGTISKFVWAGFFNIYPSLAYVSRDVELRRSISCEESTVSPARGYFAVLRSCSTVFAARRYAGWVCMSVTSWYTKTTKHRPY